MMITSLRVLMRHRDIVSVGEPVVSFLVFENGSNRCRRQDLVSEPVKRLAIKPTHADAGGAEPEAAVAVFQYAVDVIRAVNRIR